MACRTPAENALLTNLSSLKRTAELKKKLLLAEGQKKAYIGDWTQREKQNADLIAELKKEIKQLTEKLKQLNYTQGRRLQKPKVGSGKVAETTPYPVGAKNAEEAVQICDLQLIELVKRTDLLNANYTKRKAYSERLYAQYQQLKAQAPKTDTTSDGADGKTDSTPTTVEDEASRKEICRLENEIHRTNVQWMEAEHIRKKYKAISASLRSDAEKFEKSLQELEAAMVEQQADINRMQEINQEALQMRDGTKVGLIRQEHSAHQSAKSRDRQAFDFRRQVEERKSELERLERKLFATGKPILQQGGSVESLNGDPLSGTSQVVRQDSTLRAQDETSALEQTFKVLMETTGATSTVEVLERFLGQKESTSRLNYLRTVTESEKKHLEMQREQLTSQLETSKFTSDIKETEENQEELEQLKLSIEQEIDRATKCEVAIEHTGIVIDSIKSTLLDLILKLQEVDEVIDPPRLRAENDEDVPFELVELLTGNPSDELLLQVLEDKIRKGMNWCGEMIGDKDSPIQEDEDATTKVDELDVQLHSRPESASPRPPTSLLDDKERPLAFPACYSSLIIGRSSGQMSSASPGQRSQSLATDDEAEVPTRGYIKRQAQYIVDAKSRRKGFRAPRR